MGDEFPSRGGRSKPTENSNVESLYQKTYEQAEKDLIVFVEQKIDQMNNNLLFSGCDNPPIGLLNQAWCEYESVMLGLLSMHGEARIQMQIAEEKYQDFEAACFVKTKKEQASLGNKGAVNDIKMISRTENMTELATLKAQWMLAENQYNTINHLIEAWKAYQFVLSNLSANARAEAAASGVAYNHPYEFGDEEG